MTPLYPQKLALTSPTGGGRSVGIVRSRTKATEFCHAYYMKIVASIDLFCCLYFIHGQFKFLWVVHFYDREI